MTVKCCWALHKQKLRDWLKTAIKTALTIVINSFISSGICKIEKSDQFGNRYVIGMISMKQSSPDYVTTVTLHLHNYENNKNSCHGNNSITMVTIPIHIN